MNLIPIVLFGADQHATVAICVFRGCMPDAIRNCTPLLNPQCLPVRPRATPLSCESLGEELWLHPQLNFPHSTTILFAQVTLPQLPHLSGGLFGGLAKGWLGKKRLRTDEDIKTDGDDGGDLVCSPQI